MRLPARWAHVRAAPRWVSGDIPLNKRALHSAYGNGQLTSLLVFVIAFLLYRFIWNSWFAVALMIIANFYAQRKLERWLGYWPYDNETDPD
jgi:hypothetical protein